MKEYYTLSELPKNRWNITEEDILRLASVGKLTLSVHVAKLYTNEQLGGERSFSWTRIEDDIRAQLKTVMNIIHSDALDFLTKPVEDISIPRLADHSGNIFETSNHRSSRAPKLVFRRADLMIEAEQVYKYEIENPSIKKIDLDQVDLIEAAIATSKHQEGPVNLTHDNPEKTSSLLPITSFDFGFRVSKWAAIAKYMTDKSGEKVSISKAKVLLEDRRFHGKAVKQGGNIKGGVWAWSKALDSIVANPVGTPKKKK